MRRLSPPSERETFPALISDATNGTGGVHTSGGLKSNMTRATAKTILKLGQDSHTLCDGNNETLNISVKLEQTQHNKGLSEQLDYQKERSHITSHQTQDKSQCMTYVWRLHCLAKRPHTPTRFLCAQLVTPQLVTPFILNSKERKKGKKEERKKRRQAGRNERVFVCSVCS